MRCAIARAATRRGCSSTTGPSSVSAGGTRVVLPAPGCAVTTRARERRTWSTIAGINGSIGRLGLNANTDRTADAGAAEAAVSVGILGEVLLMIVLGVIEFGRRQDLSGDGSEARGFQRGLVR